jgi:hypothetical protein
MSSQGKHPQLVIFTTNNARVIRDDPSEWPTALVSPDRSAVKGVAPHFWKCVDGKLAPMSAPEKFARLAEHEMNGVDNDIERYRKGGPKPTEKPVEKRVEAKPSGWSFSIDRAYWAALAGAAAGFIAGYVL